jgi:DNA-directed RNA polymerase specialized sigma24 family protein
MLGAPQPLSQAFRDVGAAIHGRVRRVAGDEAEAQRAAEALFVRLVVHGRLAGDPRARWAWIYRVATAHGLRALADGARPGGEMPEPPSAAAAAVPVMRELREVDEATQNIVVLTALDGLPVEEVAEVLALEPALVRRKLEAWAGRAGGGPGAAPDGEGHPSLFALQRDRAALAGHVAACPSCRAIVDGVDARARQFADGVTPATLARVARDLRAERAKSASNPRWARIFWMAGAFVAITVMAFVVARPREIKPEQLPFRGPITAARLKAAGLQIMVRRGSEVLALAPGQPSRIGDRLHFRVRAEGPRYLELRAQGPGGETRIFPADGKTAALVAPGETLSRDFVVDGPLAVPGRALWIVGRFAPHAFPLDAPGVPSADLELVPVRLDLEH